MLALSTIIADITLTNAQITYFIVAAIVGLLAEFIVGWRLPFGFLGAIIAALLGIWLLTNVITVIIPFDVMIYGVPVIKALLGAIVLVALWHLVTYRLWRGRSHIYRRYSERDE